MPHRDMKNTKGHVSGLMGGQWHPTDRNTVSLAYQLAMQPCARRALGPFRVVLAWMMSGWLHDV